MRVSRRHVRIGQIFYFLTRQKNCRFLIGVSVAGCQLSVVIENKNQASASELDSNQAKRLS